MLFVFFEQLESILSAEMLGALSKITLRAVLAALIGFLPAVLLGRYWIRWLKRRFREPIISDSPKLNELHSEKRSTPTMGGLVVLIGLISATLLLADLTNRYVQVAIFVAIGFGAIGAVDDLTKLTHAKNGISARGKLMLQVAVATVAALILYLHKMETPDGPVCNLLIVDSGLSLGLWFIPLSVLVIVGTSNAVNLTDGLDGLAGGCLIFAIGAMTPVVYACGHAGLADYLGLHGVQGVGELAVFGGAMIGGVLGFLWFNCHPAEVFMGDTGSLPLGGLLGVLAVSSGQELLLIVIGGVFVLEAVSVIMQVGWFKMTRRRIFRCAPLHHHFQFAGHQETKIVVRFWIAAALFAAMGFALLKVNIRDNTPSDRQPIHIAAEVDNSTVR